MRFAKMHGLGNDFVMVNNFTESLPNDIHKFAATICDRHIGIGGDGLLVLTRPKGTEAAARYQIYNSDGSESGMCGNGLRCAALFAKREGIVDSDAFVFEVQSGLVSPHILDEEKGLVRVDMGAPRLRPEEIPAQFSGSRVVGAPLEVLAREYQVTLVSVGNPHCVIFVDDVDNFPVEKIGPLIETSPLFPEKTNVEFVQLLPDRRLKMRVWERACGETLACGSGACAATVAAILNGYIKEESEVLLRLGSLHVKWAENNHVYMTGTATFVAEGNYFAGA